MQRAEANARVLAKAGDFPLLGGGDVNLYSLFVERAQALVKPGGLVALLTLSGIAADKGAAEFFKRISATGRWGALFDFENKKVFFPDVHASFKFCTLVFGGAERQFEQARCAFFLHSLAELDRPDRTLALTREDCQLVNPNTGAAPIFRSRRDADLTPRLYRENPVLIRHRGASETQGVLPDRKAWPVKYLGMFPMANHSGLFLKQSELRAQGWQPGALGRWRLAGAQAVPLYAGKMIQMFDHRAADVVLNPANLHRAAQPEAIQTASKERPDRFPIPQGWVRATDTSANGFEWALGFRRFHRPCTFTACLRPKRPMFWTASRSCVSTTSPPSVFSAPRSTCWRSCARSTAACCRSQRRSPRQPDRYTFPTAPI